MNAESVITLVILLICAVPFIALGVIQIRSEKPVGFWSGMKPPAAERITDVGAYNRKHGVMWIVYGAGLVVSFYLGMLLGGKLLPAVLMLVEVVGGIFLMILYHNHLDKRYVRKNGKDGQ